MIGLAGAHRTGKTTLARAFAEKAKLTFVETSTSAIMREAGFDPRQPMTTRERLTVQRIVLERTVRDHYRKAPGSAICDRTPIDMLAYTLADIRGDSLSAEEEKDLKAYAVDCYMAANHFFAAILLVQPGIPIVDAEGKAAPSAGYMEHLNSLILGLLLDERLTAKPFFIPRHKTNLEARIESAQQAWDRTLERAMLAREQASGVEAILH